MGGNDTVVSSEIASRYAVEFELELDDSMRRLSSCGLCRRERLAYLVDDALPASGCIRSTVTAVST